MIIFSVLLGCVLGVAAVLWLCKFGVQIQYGGWHDFPHNCDDCGEHTKGYHVLFHPKYSARFGETWLCDKCFESIWSKMPRRGGE